MAIDFAAIRARAAERKGGEAALAALLGPAPDHARVASLPDDRILSSMAERVFAAGFVWRVIEQKWPGFEAAFLGFEPKRLLFQPDDFWHDLSRDARIVLYCAAGARSAAGAERLRAAGFTDVADLDGGIRAWSGPLSAPAEGMGSAPPGRA